MHFSISFTSSAILALYSTTAAAMPLDPDSPLLGRAVTKWASVTSEYGFGECWFDFVSAYKINRVHCAAKDTKGNSHSVWADACINSAAVGWVTDTDCFAEWNNKDGSGKPETYDQEFHSYTTRNKLNYVTVRICDNGPGSDNKCKSSGKVDNPYA